MKIKGIVAEKKPAVKIGAGVIAVLMIVYGIAQGQYAYIPVGALLGLACFFRKEHIISEEGLDIVSHMLGKPSHDLWSWDQIDAIRTDRQKVHPNVQIHIAKESTVRVFTTTPDNCTKVLELAHRMNPDIHIMD